MGAERCDYYSDEEYHQALQHEEMQWQEDDTPDVVPCYKCGNQMYEVSPNFKENICDDCSDEVKKRQKEVERITKEFLEKHKKGEIKVEDLPF